MFRTKTQNNVSLKPPPVICVSGLQSYYESACKFALCFRYFETQNLIKSMHTEQIGNWWQPLTWQPCNHPGKEHSRMNGSSPYRGPVRDEKMLSITNHQEDTNQSHGEMPPHSHQDGSYKKETERASWERKEEPTHKKWSKQEESVSLKTREVRGILPWKVTKISEELSKVY